MPSVHVGRALVGGGGLSVPVVVWMVSAGLPSLC